MNESIVNTREMLVRNDMDVNEHERQFYTLAQIKVKEHRYDCCSTCHSHSRVCNNKHTSYCN